MQRRERYLAISGFYKRPVNLWPLPRIWILLQKRLQIPDQRYAIVSGVVDGLLHLFFG